MRLPNKFLIRRRQAALIFALLTLFVLGLLMPEQGLAASPESARDIDRGSPFFANAAAAEAATEYMFSQMSLGFPLNNGSLTNYGSPVPLGTLNAYYQNFIFYNPRTGATNSTYVVNIGTNSSAPPYGPVPYGLNGFQSRYGIYSNAKSAGDPGGLSAAQARLDVLFASVPLFQFAIYYNGLMEFSDTAVMFVNGRVHANSNIYVGSPANLTFNSLVTCTGTISAPSNAGFSSNSWTGKVTYNGAPSPGYLTGVPALTVPISSDNSSAAYHEIVNPPAAGENPNSLIGVQRYYNKAEMTLMISNSGFSMILKNSVSDPYPVAVTNWSAISNWVGTNVNFFDQREGKYMLVTEINIGKFTNWLGTWLGTNSATAGKFTSNNPLNIIYIADYRSTNNNQNTAVRLRNGASLPTAGLAVATPNPLYVWGNYNCPNPAHLGTTNTTATAPASLVCDAVTILSPAWVDAASSGSLSARAAASATVNAAVIAGIVPSTGTVSTDYSGGVQNLPRLLEDWSNDTLTLNTSFACLFNSTSATGRFQLPGSYYYAPQIREFSFDMNYMTPAKLPPGTPQIIVPAFRTYQAIESPDIVPP